MRNATQRFRGSVVDKLCTECGEVMRGVSQKRQLCKKCMARREEIEREMNRKPNIFFCIVDEYTGQTLCGKDMQPLTFRGKSAMAMYMESKNLNPEMFRSKILGYEFEQAPVLEPEEEHKTGFCTV